MFNFIVNVEKRITNLLKDVKISKLSSETVYKSLKPRASKFGILYGHFKVHKHLIDNCPPFRLIMSDKPIMRLIMRQTWMTQLILAISL